ncbi:MAG: hypothetical protein R3D55_08000 [Chloroflexota bacterium]
MTCKKPPLHGAASTSLSLALAQFTCLLTAPQPTSSTTLPPISPTILSSFQPLES